MADVQLDIIDLSTGGIVATFTLAICTPQTYQLDLGSYRLKATYLPTGEVQTYDLNIVAGVNTPHDFEFTPPSLKIDSTPIQGITFTIERVS